MEHVYEGEIGFTFGGKPVGEVPIRVVYTVENGHPIIDRIAFEICGTWVDSDMALLWDAVPYYGGIEKPLDRALMDEAKAVAEDAESEREDARREAKYFDGVDAAGGK